MPKVALGALVKSLKYEVRPGEGLAGAVWQTGEPIIVEDYNWPGRIPNYGHNLIRSIIGVPLLVGSQVREVLALANDVNTEGTFGPETVEVLTQFARLAEALQLKTPGCFPGRSKNFATASGRRALRRYAERLATINRLARVISSNLDIAQIYDTFVKELQALVPLVRTSIVLLNEAGDQWQVAQQWTKHQPVICPANGGRRKDRP